MSRDTIDDLIRAIESENGYLADPWLDRLRAFGFAGEDAARFLVWLPNVRAHLSMCCAFALTRAANEFGHPAHFLEFHTGGWSGAEELVSAALRHFWIAHFHTKWFRGGHFYFEIPDAWLAPPPT